MIIHVDPRKLIEEFAKSIAEADPKKLDEIFSVWPELARSLAYLIETLTEYNAPKVWWGPAQINVFCDEANEVRKATILETMGFTTILCNNCGSSSHGVVR